MCDLTGAGTCLGVSSSLILLPSNRNRRDVTGTPWRNQGVQRLLNEKIPLKYVIFAYHSFTVGLFELAHLCCHFNPEVDFVRVLANHLQFDVFGSSISIVLVILPGDDDIVISLLQHKLFKSSWRHWQKTRETTKPCATLTSAIL